MRTKTILKGILAILAGLLSGIILSIGTDAILEATGVFPSFQDQVNGELLTQQLLILATVYRCIYTGLSCYIGAKLAPSHPMRYSMSLGSAAFIANLAGLPMVANLSQLWYPIVLAILAVPCAWVGGKCATRSHTRSL